MLHLPTLSVCTEIRLASLAWPVITSQAVSTGDTWNTDIHKHRGHSHMWRLTIVQKRVVPHTQLLFSVTFDLQYGIPFYLQYLAHWPEYFIVAEAPGGELMGYSKSVSHTSVLLQKGCFLLKKNKIKRGRFSRHTTSRCVFFSSIKYNLVHISIGHIEPGSFCHRSKSSVITSIKHLLTATQ